MSKAGDPGLPSGLTGPLSPAPTPPQPEELTNILEICNVVFTSMFALEMLLKLAAFGLFDYLRNPYNIFDSVIVIIRCSPLPQHLPSGEGGGSKALTSAGK